MSGSANPATGNLRLALDKIDYELSKEPTGGPTAGDDYDIATDVDLSQLTPGSELRFLESGAKPGIVRAQQRRPRSQLPDTITLNRATRKYFLEATELIETEIIDPMIAAERKAIWVGALYYAVLIFAAVLAGALVRAPYADIGALAVGTGGAVVALQPFADSITSYYRIRRTLENIASTWKLEAEVTVSSARQISKQMRTFFDDATKMPALYLSPAPSGDKKK